MITIICGEDTASSRAYYRVKQEEYAKKGIEVRTIDAGDIATINTWLGESPGLFFEKHIFFSEGLNKKIRRDSKTLISEIKKLSDSGQVEIIIWEPVSARTLKIGKFGTVKEFKPKESVFKLLDLIKPGGASSFLPQLNLLCVSYDPSFVFAMISRHVRLLIVVKTGVRSSSLPSWQYAKLAQQAAVWKTENIIAFYEGLHRIDVGQKTGGAAFSVKDALDILAIHFL